MPGKSGFASAAGSTREGVQAEVDAAQLKHVLEADGFGPVAVRTWRDDRILHRRGVETSPPPAVPRIGGVRQGVARMAPGHRVEERPFANGDVAVVHPAEELGEKSVPACLAQSFWAARADARLEPLRHTDCPGRDSRIAKERASYWGLTNRL